MEDQRSDKEKEQRSKIERKKRYKEGRRETEVGVVKCRVVREIRRSGR